jgi:Predicted membrane protein (DUF2142)
MRTSPIASFWRRVGIAWALLALLGAVWALATPIGGSPDEPAHLIKAASVARGQLVGPTVKGGTRVTVPEFIAYSQADTCFAFHANTTPNCTAADPKSPTALVSAVTSAGLYNPVFYALVGWPSLVFSGTSAIYAMRIVSDLIAALFLALAFGMIALWRRPTIALIGFAAAVTPMVLFLDGAVNPNSVEISATLAAFVAVLSIVREPGRDWLALRAAIVFAGAAIAANMRGLSLIWVAVAVLTPLLLVPRARIGELLKTRAIRLAILGTAVACLGAAIWVFGTNSLGIGQSGSTIANGAPGVGTSHLAGFAWNLGSTFFYAQQVVGVFGWLDTAAPPAVYFVWSILVGGVLIAGLVALRGRALRFSVVLIALVVLLPPILQGYYITTGGIIWQGRYILPVFVCVLVGVAACLGDVVALPRPIERRLVIIVLIAWSAAQVLAFATTLKRYAVGSKPGWPAMLHPVWSPPGGVDVIVVAFIVVAAATAVSAWALVSRRSSAAPSGNSEPALT